MSVPSPSRAGNPARLAPAAALALVVALVALVAPARPAAAAPASACGVDVAPSTGALTFVSEPFSAAPERRTASIRVSDSRARSLAADGDGADAAAAPIRVAGAGSRRLRLRIVTADGAPLPAALDDATRLTVRGGGGGWRAVGGATFETRLDAGGSARALDLDVLVDSRGTSPPGDTSRTLRIDVLDMDDGARCEDVARLRVLRSVPSRVQLNVAGISAGFDRGLAIGRIDLGTLDDGARRRLFVQVRANRPTRLSVTSEHGGLLRHEDRDASIRYGLALDGRPLDLVGGAVRLLSVPTSGRGHSLPLDLVVPSSRGKPAGRYEDLLVFEVSGL